MKFSFYLVVFFAFSGSVLAQSDSDTKAKTPQDLQMQAFIQAGTPGEEHKLLQSYVGKWNHIVTMWMKPEALPEISKGTTETESILGGRFIHQRINGISMGQPFEGLGLTGYDNVKKHFSTVWLDNMGTGMMLGTGVFDQAKKAIVDSGSFSCPMSASGTVNYRAVWTLPEKNSFKYEMFAPGEDGKEFRMMEVVYTKAQ